MDIRYSTGKIPFRTMTTDEMRDEFLVKDIFKKDDVTAVYSHIDRIVTMGAMPVSGAVRLDKNIDAMKDFGVDFFLQRREIGMINIGGDGIVVAGFSAGGHLAASLGCYWGFGLLDDLVPHSKDEIRPNYMLLCYPVITADVKHCHEGSIRNALGKNNLDMRDFVSIENHVEPSFPPTFMWHTLEDEAVPAENSLLLAMALRREGVDFEYHLFQKGCHGLSLATPETAKPDGSCQQKECAVWPELFKAWFDSRVRCPESVRE